MSLYDLYLILMSIDSGTFNKERAVDNCAYLIKKYGYYCQIDINCVGMLMEGRI